MDDLVLKLKQLTDQLVETLDNATYEEIDEFVQQREEIMTEFQTRKFSSSELDNNRETMKQILQHDQIILERMKALKDEATQSINKISSGKAQKNAYDKFYSMDGVYFDKKK
jgi:cytoplasmic iron level regulating protein YaaA (DUF328/UPF0246 family)